MLLLLADCLMGDLTSWFSGSCLADAFCSLFVLTCIIPSFFLSEILFGLMHDMSDNERREMQLGHHVVWEGEKKEGKSIAEKE